MVTASLTTFTIQADAKVKVVWADGHSNIYLNLDALKADVSILDSDATTAERLLLAWFLARQPDGSNVNVVQGKTLTFDLASNSPIKVQ